MKTAKPTFVLLCLLILTISLNATDYDWRTKLRFKAFGGYVSSWAASDMKSAKVTDGYQLGATVTFPIYHFQYSKDNLWLKSTDMEGEDYLALEPGIRYVTKGYEKFKTTGFDRYIDKHFSGDNVHDRTLDLETAYFDVFFRLKYINSSIPLQPFFGMSGSFLTKADQKIRVDTDNGQKEIKIDMKDDLSEYDITLILGSEVVFSRWFMLEFEYNFGLKHLYKESVDPKGLNRSLMLSAGFTF